MTGAEGSRGTLAGRGHQAAGASSLGTWATTQRGSQHGVPHPGINGVSRDVESQQDKKAGRRMGDA